MTAVPELKTHWRIGKRGGEKRKLQPTCLKTSLIFWWSGRFIQVAFKRIDIEHWTLLIHWYGQAEGNTQFLEKYLEAGCEKAPAAACGWGWDPPGSLQPPAHFSLHLCSLCFPGTPLSSLLTSPLYSPPLSLPCFFPFSLSLLFLHLYSRSSHVVNDIIRISLLLKHL